MSEYKRVAPRTDGVVPPDEPAKEAPASAPPKEAPKADASEKPVPKPRKASTDE